MRGLHLACWWMKMVQTVHQKHAAHRMGEPEGACMLDYNWYEAGADNHSKHGPCDSERKNYFLSYLDVHQVV